MQCLQPHHPPSYAEQIRRERQALFTLSRVDRFPGRTNVLRHSNNLPVRSITSTHRSNSLRASIGVMHNIRIAVQSVATGRQYRSIRSDHKTHAILGAPIEDAHQSMYRRSYNLRNYGVLYCARYTPSTPTRAISTPGRPCTLHTLQCSFTQC